MLVIPKEAADLCKNWMDDIYKSITVPYELKVAVYIA